MVYPTNVLSWTASLADNLIVKLLPSLTLAIAFPPESSAVKIYVSCEESTIFTDCEASPLFNLNTNISGLVLSVIKSSTTLKVAVAVLLLMVKLPVLDSTISLSSIPSIVYPTNVLS